MEIVGKPRAGIDHRASAECTIGSKSSSASSRARQAAVNSSIRPVVFGTPASCCCIDAQRHRRLADGQREIQQLVRGNSKYGGRRPRAKPDTEQIRHPIATPQPRPGSWDQQFRPALPLVRTCRAGRTAGRRSHRAERDEKIPHIADCAVYMPGTRNPTREVRGRGILPVR